MIYMDDRLGFVDDQDAAWTMDDFGSLVPVPFTLPAWYWQEV